MTIHAASNVSAVRSTAVGPLLALMTVIASQINTSQMTDCADDSAITTPRPTLRWSR